MSLDNLHDIRIFNQVVLSHSFTAAANALQIPVSIVSRRVAALESRLGVRLLNRSTRKLSLTAEGELLCRRSNELLDEFEQLRLELTKSKRELSGTIRIAVRTTTVKFGFISDLVETLKSAQHLNIQLLVNDSPIDVIKEGVDLALMIHQLPDSSLIQRKLGQVIFCLCASPQYLNEHTAPRTPQELHSHDFISPLKTHTQTSLTLRKRGARSDQQFKIQPRFQSNDIRARAAAIYAGMGIGNLPEAEVKEGQKHGKLVRVLADYHLPPIPVWAVKPIDKKNDARLRLIEELLIQAGKRMSDEDLGHIHP